MIVPLALLLLAQTAKTPDLPAGINSAVMGDMYLVETKLQAGDFDGAAKLAAELPKRDIRIGWDVSAVPEVLRTDFTAAFNKAISRWNTAEKVHIAIGDNPDITFSFKNTLPKQGNGDFPAGATVTWLKDGPERVDVQIALHRLETQDDITPADVHNEVAFAMGQYFGLTLVPSFGSFATRTDQNTDQEVVLDTFNQSLAASALDCADQLRELVASKTAVAVHEPEMNLSTGEITGLNGTQYLPLQVSFTVQNKGDADLKLIVLPDCSCLRPHAPPVIKPHETGTIVADVNTSVYAKVGLQNHSLMIYSNDPKFALSEIPVQMHIAPLYRFVRSSHDSTQLGPQGLDMDVYLFIVDKVTIEPLTASINGPKGTVQFQKWSGVLPFDEEAKGASESGYKFHIHIAPSSIGGRIPATLMVGTDNDAFREMVYTFYLQKGIIADPAELYLGRLRGLETKGSFLVTRPGKPFHILKVLAMDPHLSAKVHDLGKTDEYRVDVVFSGSYPLPAFNGQVKLVTDDPSNPSILVPVSGSGR